MGASTSGAHETGLLLAGLAHCGALGGVRLRHRRLVHGLGQQVRRPEPMMLPRRGMCRLLAVQPVGRGRGSSLQLLLLLLLLLLLVLLLLSLPLHDLLLLLLGMRRRLSDVLLPLHLQVMRVWYSVAGGRRRRVRHVVLLGSKLAIRET